MQPGRFLDGAADAGDATAMAFDPWQMPPLRPAAVAIHDNGDVAREALRGNAFEGLGLLYGGGHGV